MDKKQALSDFSDFWRAVVKSNPRAKNDKPMKRMYFNDYTDSLCKSGQITQKQYSNWSNPF